MALSTKVTSAGRGGGGGGGGLQLGLIVIHQKILNEHLYNC